MADASRSLLDYIDSPILVGDPDGCVVHVNPAFEQAFGIRGDVTMGASIANIFEGGGREAMLRAVVEVCGGAAPERFRIRERDSGWIALASPVDVDAGRVGVIVLLTPEPGGEDRLHGLRREVLEPLGMRDTELARLDRVQPRRAQCYVVGPDGPLREPAYRWENWGAAGGLLSSLGDLHRWNRALARNELLSPETTELMLTPDPAIQGEGAYVALGSWVYPRALPGSDLRPTLVERRGAIGGATILNVLVRDEDRWIVVLSNAYDEGVHQLPWAGCLPLDLLLVLEDLEPLGPDSAGQPR